MAGPGRRRPSPTQSKKEFPRSSSRSPSRTTRRSPTRGKKGQVDSADEDTQLSTVDRFPFKDVEYFHQTEGKRRKWRAAKQIIADLPSTAPYRLAAAPPSLCPHSASYCDVTGLIGLYTDPKTGLRYHNAAVYQWIRGLSPNAVQSLLHIRGAGVTI